MTALIPAPSLALRRFAWGFLAFSIAVILWGTIVRATGSGAGCGDHWPLCNGTVVQHSASTQTMIEFTHRITSFLSILGVLVLLILTFRSTPKGHLARYSAVASVVLMFVEALLGAMLVVLGLTAQSTSPLRAPYLALHLTNTLLLLAAVTLTAHFLSRTHGLTLSDVQFRAPLTTLSGVAIVLIVAVTGSLAALGDTLFPAETLASALHEDISAASSWLIRWRWTHPAVAVLAACFLLWILARAIRQGSHGKIWNNRPLALFLFSLLVVEYILGALNVALLAPVWMQVIHLLAADILWAALVVLAARLTLMPKH